MTELIFLKMDDQNVIVVTDAQGWRLGKIIPSQIQFLDVYRFQPDSPMAYRASVLNEIVEYMDSLKSK